MGKLIYGIIGHPVRHSLSPAMQNAAFNQLGIDATYGLYDVEPAGLDDFLKDVSREGKVSGLNVTIPHKIASRIYLEKNGALDENAKRLGAVNTIKVEAGGKMRGFNTDGAGFYRSLVEDLGFEPEGKDIFMLGAGGASTAIVMYLGNGPKTIFVNDVDEKKLAELKKRYAMYYDEKRINIVKSQGLKEAIDRCTLLINATPIGMEEPDPSPVDKALLHSGLYVYDLVYNRPLTRLVREANAAKLHAVTGIGMLLYQGAIAFEIWTGKRAPVGVMRKALKNALKKG